ncbi:STYKc [Nesidiocoris tenuis]|uniref:non-specific serine/threonine protein kinase n=1 Tax=Nesidiocoris tenuis TaxID=355587 RepID=A0ABN7ACI3_9HEMI|nr:STYKc [Nesidiocoris tenuis]
MKGSVSKELELRKLPAKYAFTLAQILEVGQGWKELMAKIPDLDRPPQLKYTVEHMRLIEEASSKLKRTCSEILLDEWGTSGRIRPNLSTLVELLAAAQLYRAAEYISLDVMNGAELERPSDGPAARVRIPDTEELLSMATLEPSTTVSPLSTQSTVVAVSGPAHSQINDPDLNDRSAKTGILKSMGTSSSNYQGQDDVTRRICQDLTQCSDETGVCVFAYEELVRSTNGFDDSQLLGRGGFGSVYKAHFPQHGSVAVKKLLSEGAAIEGLTGDQFSNELLLVAGLKHPNILSLTGYSCDGPDLCLVYPFMANGSLQDRLECKGGTPVLSWQTRISISQETASGLNYLHTQQPKPLVHRDMKSANVLLTDGFTVKIADFGLVRHASRGSLTDSVMLTTTVLGTSAYMAPEAFRGDISTKMDVFSFGVVLLELVTGLPPFDEERSGCDLASHVEEIDNFNDLRDHRLGSESVRAMQQLYDVALACLLEKKSRPPMQQVVNLLQSISETDERATEGCA